jgi:outer membrane protein TolC
VLDAQERLTDAEFNFVAAQIDYTLSVSELKRAMGTLLEAEKVEVSRSSDRSHPAVILDIRD